MRVAPYWVRKVCCINGKQYKLRAYSFRSMEEAVGRLEEKVHLLSELARNGGGEAAVSAMRKELRTLDEIESREYEVVITEPVLRRVDEANVITRNRYGAEVLNSADTCFLDVDQYYSLTDRILQLIGLRKQGNEKRLLEAVRKLCQENAAMGVRVYRTAHGWRLLVAAENLGPDSPQMDALCKRLQVDELYAGLCRKQKCWRARLTPKPYYMGLGRYPLPGNSEAAASETADWVARYTEKSAEYSVCRLVETFGAKICTPIVELHDQATGALLPDRPLK